MAQTDLTQLWETLGLTRSEVETYEFLLREGPTTASSVAKAMRTSRGRTYQTLRTLAEHGLVREEPLEPIEYVPVPPAEVIQQLVAEGQRRVRELEALGQTAVPAEPRSSPAAHAPPPSVSVLRGRRGALAEAVRLIDSAHWRVLAAGAGLFLDRLRERGVVAALHAKAKEGTDVALVVSAEAAQELQQRPELASSLRIASFGWTPPSPLNWLVADDVALMMAPSPDDASGTHGEDFCLRLAGPTFADGIASWVEALVRQTAGGPVQGLPASDAAQRLETAVRSAASSVELMGPVAWLGAIAPSDSLAQALAQARARGIRVRVLTEMDPAGWDTLRSLAQVGEARVGRSVPVAAALVDQQSAFVGLPAPDGFLVRTSSEAFELHHLVGLFERFWDQAAPVAV